MIGLPTGWSLSRRTAPSDFRWLVHRCGYISDQPVHLALTEAAVTQIITNHACPNRPPAASQVIHGHACPREQL